MVALQTAAIWHAAQTRKGEAEIPYISHLMSVSALVWEDIGDEDEAIAGLLHDSIEDAGVTHDQLERLFGARVADLVVACTDTDADPKPPWKPRKDAHIAELVESIDGGDPGRFRVAAADKLANLRTILTDARADGTVFDRFQGGLGGTAWYYGAMTAALQAALPTSKTVGDLSSANAQLREIFDARRAELGELPDRFEAALRSRDPLAVGADRADDNYPWLALELARRSVAGEDELAEYASRVWSASRGVTAAVEAAIVQATAL